MYLSSAILPISAANPANCKQKYLCLFVLYCGIEFGSLEIEGLVEGEMRISSYE
jgi:hypothetical protein